MLLSRLKRRLRRRRRLQMTREGRYFVAITVGVGLAAINTGNNLLYLLLGWLLSVIIASGALSDVVLRRLRVSRRLPAHAHANRPFEVELTAHNGKRWSSSFAIEVEDMISDRVIDKRVFILKVPNRTSVRATYRHSLPRRGVYRYTGYRISTRFPFSLFDKSRIAGGGDEILVYPAITPMPTPAPRAHQIGHTSTGKIGRRGDFFGLREYRDGDDRRSIHWRSSARAGRPLVREVEQEAQRRASLFLDNSLPADPDPEARETLERAIELTASLASSYLKAGYSVRLVTRSNALPYSAGREQLHQVLRMLALLEIASPGERFAAPIDPGHQNLIVVPRGRKPTRGESQAFTHFLEAS